MKPTRRSLGPCHAVSLAVACALSLAACNLDFAERRLPERSDISPSDLDAGEDSAVTPDTGLDTSDTAAADVEPDTQPSDTSSDTIATDLADADTAADAGGDIVIEPPTSTVRVPDTPSHTCISVEGLGACPASGEPYFGQDASYDIHLPLYDAMSEEMALDTITGLSWVREPWQAFTASGIEMHCGTVTLGGHNDWRLPSLPELMTLVDYGRNSDVYDTAVFGPLDAVATASFSSQRRLYIDMRQGRVLDSAMVTTARNVLCVRDVWPVRDWVVVDAAGEVVHDRSLALMWTTRSRAAATWDVALAECEALELAGAADWRMPTIKEATTLIGTGDAGRATLDPTVFTVDASAELWTATPDGPLSNATVTGSYIRTLHPGGDVNYASPGAAAPWLCVRSTDP